MRRKLTAVFVTMAALAIPANALADGSPTGGSGTGAIGQAQVNDQVASTLQLAFSEAKATENAVNANTPSNVAGGNIATGASTADQAAGNNADADRLFADVMLSINAIASGLRTTG